MKLVHILMISMAPLFQVIALYKEGHDGLGEEVLSSVADKGSLGVRLLHVAVLRLTKHIYESEDHARKLAAVKPELMSRFCQLQDEARELRVDCGLKAGLPSCQLFKLLDFSPQSSPKKLHG